MKRTGPLVLSAILGVTVWAGFPAAPDLVISRIMQEEGFRPKPYRDSAGILTIGYGTNLRVGISRAGAEFLAREHLAKEYESLNKAIPWMKDLPVKQQAALLDLGYQIGVHGVLGFHDMLQSLKDGDCKAAQQAAYDSDWRAKTPAREKRVASLLCEGE